jgi:hypothetical protein
MLVKTEKRDKCLGPLPVSSIIVFPLRHGGVVRRSWWWINLYTYISKTKKKEYLGLTEGSVESDGRGCLNKNKDPVVGRRAPRRRSCCLDTNTYRGHAMWPFVALGVIVVPILFAA